MATSSQSSTVVGVVVAVLIIAAIGSLGYYQFEVAPHQSTTTTTSSGQAQCTPKTCAHVTIYPGASTLAPGFRPGTITVYLGVNNTVVWLNNDSQSGGIPHTVSADDGSWGSGNTPLNLGDSYQYTFNSAGTYTYKCTIHPAVMAGEVIVKAAPTSVSTSSTSTSSS